MPALKLFGRKWLVGTDDMVIPCLFELVVRVIWLVLMSLVTNRYYTYTYKCAVGGEHVRIYLIGMLVFVIVAIVLLIALINRSAQGSIIDVQARRHVPLLIGLKIVLFIPEGLFNILGTVWAFTKVIECPDEDIFTSTVIDILVCFDWVVIGLVIFIMFMMLDPIGSIKLRGSQPDISLDSLKNRKITRIWVRRFRWFFCWLIRDKQSHEAFSQVASLFSSLFRDSDCVPSDIMAGFVLLRVKQKRESREQRRIELLAEQRLKYTSDVKEAFANVPSWMNLEIARHYMLLSMAAYGYPFVFYLYICTGACKLLSYLKCCACFRKKRTIVKEDNCCLCYFGAVKYLSKVSDEEILFANFGNRIYKLPFYIVACSKTKNIVLVIRGSFSVRDVFTDLTCLPEKIEAEGLPPDSMAHKGMLNCATNLKTYLAETGILDKCLAQYPNYGLVITGQSLGAGVSVIMGILLRPTYPDLKVYAFSTPAGVLSYEAAKYTEKFVMTVGIGDDFIMRLSVESIEEMRAQLFTVLQSCRLPKYRVMVNGFGYALFGIPSRDLEATWRNDRPLSFHRHQFVTFLPAPNSAPYQYAEVAKRKFSKVKLYTAGKILHIAYKKKSKEDKEAGIGDTYEMRWLQIEDFTEIRVMPRMMLDHLPENVYKAIDTVLNEQTTEIDDFPNITLV